ncbi:TerB family tellurite resistance protein [Oligoflexia bacterium]|nr:TerB family tellurite resistance protein [Oligoflexia bacterium]
MDLLKLFDFSSKEKENLGTLFAKLSALLRDMPDDEVRYVTGLSGLLGKVAHSDLEFSEDELEKIQQIMQQSLGLATRKIAVVLDILRDLTVDLAGIEDHHYTRLVNACVNKDEKKAILESLFCVAAADRSITGEEEKTIRSIATGLALSNNDFIAAKTKYQEHLSVLQGKGRH